MIDLHPHYTTDERGASIVVLTTEEFEQLLMWAEINSPDPDEGLTLRPEIVQEIEQQRAEYAAGNRGRTLNRRKVYQ